ncbi:MAG TPA: hypothetical protein VEF03_09895 [Candidatus Binataceae bacterium]|nr:hypothetical protein [Candidatus Binataceae bacterium]
MKTAEEFFAVADRLANILLAENAWLRVVDLHLFPSCELKLQRRLQSQSFNEDPRWYCLFGTPTAIATNSVAPSDEFLGRAAYDYAFICKELFQGTLDLHATRLLYTKAGRIHRTLGTILPWSPDLSSDFREVLQAARESERGRPRKASFPELARAHALALKELSMACECALRKPDGSRAMAMTRECIAPETMDAAVASCRETIGRLCNDLQGTLRSAMLSAVPGCAFEYRVNLVLDDQAKPEEVIAVSKAVRALYSSPTVHQQIPREYFREFFPLVLTKSAYAASARCFHALRPAEESAFLRRHGVVLWGENLRDCAILADADETRRSAAVASADLRNRIWAALHLNQPHRLLDLLMGRIAALWLVLARSEVATSPGEAVMGCVRAEMPNAEILENLYRCTAGRRRSELPGVHDNLWKPALDALTHWLDDITGMALHAIG